MSLFEILLLVGVNQGDPLSPTFCVHLVTESVVFVKKTAGPHHEKTCLTWQLANFSILNRNYIYNQNLLIIYKLFLIKVILK